MTKLLFFFSFLFGISISSCSCNYNKVDLQSLRDSLGVCMQYGLLKSDTALMYKALKITDSLLTSEKDKNAIRNCYRNRSMIFFFLQDGKNAMDNMYMSVRNLPETNINRMNYNVMKNFASHDCDSAKFFLKRNIDICDSILNTSFINEYAYLKVQYMYYLYGKQQARKCLEKIYKSHHDSLFRKTLNDWSDFCFQLNEERRKLQRLYD